MIILLSRRIKDKILKRENKEDTKNLLKYIKYKELIHVVDYIDVYEKDGLQLCVEYVNDKYSYIEIEENEIYNTIEKLINGLFQTHTNHFS